MYLYIEMQIDHNWLSYLHYIGSTGAVDESIASDIANICGLEKVPNSFVVLRYALHFALTHVLTYPLT